MRNLIIFGLMAAAIPAAGSAQQTQETRRDRQDVRQEVRQDRRDDRQDMRQDRREVRQDRRELQRDRRDMRRDRRQAYVAPYGGWNYRQVTTGYRLRPGFYGDRYVVNDYGRYNLGRPAMNQRWVRYGNDLLLINARNGRVLRVLHNRY